MSVIYSKSRHYKIPKIVYSLPVSFIGGNTSKFSVLRAEHVPKWGKTPEIVSGICELESRGLNFEFEKILSKKWLTCKYDDYEHDQSLSELA